MENRGFGGSNPSGNKINHDEENVYIRVQEKRETERERQNDRQIDRQTDRGTEKERQRHADNHSQAVRDKRKTDMHAGRQTGSQTSKPYK